MAHHADTLHRALQLVAEDLDAVTPRIHDALRVIADATGGVSARPTVGGGGTTSPKGSGISDPTARGAGVRDPARDDRRRIEQLIRELLDNSRRLSAIVDRYDPPAALQAALRGDATVTNDNLWCPNHLAHGHREPRGKGRTYCDWCDGTKRRFGRLPTARLIDAHGRGRRLGEDEYRRLLTG